MRIGIILVAMVKQCRHCRTVTNDEAPYCDACGCDFSNVPAAHVREGSPWIYLVVSLAIVFFLLLLWFGWH
jgi:hypothetical protein